MVNFAMVTVDCTRAKRALEGKAWRIRGGLLEEMARRWAEANAATKEQYDHMCETLSGEPDSPETLDEVRRGGGEGGRGGATGRVAHGA